MHVNWSPDHGAPALLSRIVHRMVSCRRTTCCIVGGGPAGLMLGLLPARAGVQVTVLEKHGDYLRGGTCMPRP